LVIPGLGAESWPCRWFSQYVGLQNDGRSSTWNSTVVPFGSKQLTPISMTFNALNASVIRTVNQTFGPQIGSANATLDPAWCGPP